MLLNYATQSGTYLLLPKWQFGVFVGQHILVAVLLLDQHLAITMFVGHPVCNATFFKFMFFEDKVRLINKQKIRNIFEYFNIY